MSRRLLERRTLGSFEIMSLRDPYSFDDYSDEDAEEQEVDAEIERTIEPAVHMDVDTPASRQTKAGRCTRKGEVAETEQEAMDSASVASDKAKPKRGKRPNDS